jgi:plastocyanin
MKTPLIVGVLLVFGISLFACSRPTSFPVALPSDLAVSVAVSVTRDNCPSLEMRPGTQVTWTNQDTQAHVVWSEGLAGQEIFFDSGELQPGDSFTFIFAEPGQFIYWCSPDKVLAGMITVQP